MVSSIKVDSYKKVREYDQIPIVQGDFPKHNNLRELSLFRFNRFLTCVFVVSAIASVLSYSMVVAKETSLMAIHNKTHEVNFENIELQNKVDYAKSFSSINDNAAKVDFLKKPDSVIEVKSLNPDPVIQSNRNNVAVKPVTGF